eukprot:493787_1
MICGDSVEYNIQQQFDMIGTTLHDIISYNIPIQSTSDAEQSFFYVTFDFINGEGCYNPLLTFTFADSDYDGVDEYIRIYYPIESPYITQCDGITLDSCAIETCLNKYDIGLNTSIINTLTIGVAKTDAVHVRAICSSYSIDATVTIQCGGKPTISPTNNPTNNPSLLPTIYPSKSPTKYPSISPTQFTIIPTNIPSKIPSNNPTIVNIQHIHQIIIQQYHQHIIQFKVQVLIHHYNQQIVQNIGYVMKHVIIIMIK